MSADKPADPQRGKPAEEEQIDAAAGDAEQAAAVGEDEAASARAESGADPDGAAEAGEKARKRPRIRRKAGEKAAAEKPAGEKAAGKRAAAKAQRGESADEEEQESSTEKAPARAERKASRERRPPRAVEGERASAKPAARSARGSGKPARRRVVRARARYVRTSARKARMVCVHLRGKTVPEARAILAFTPREVARDWSKLLESAIANAESNHELLEDDLIVREAYADEGPTIKRFRPRAMGRATPIHKRTSHLTITLTPGP